MCGNNPPPVFQFKLKTTLLYSPPRKFSVDWFHHYLYIYIYLVLIASTCASTMQHSSLHYSTCFNESLGIRLENIGHQQDRGGFYFIFFFFSFSSVLHWPSGLITSSRSVIWDGPDWTGLAFFFSFFLSLSVIRRENDIGLMVWLLFLPLVEQVCGPSFFPRHSCGPVVNNNSPLGWMDSFSFPY